MEDQEFSSGQLPSEMPRAKKKVKPRQLPSEMPRAKKKVKPRGSGRVGGNDTLLEIVNNGLAE